MGDTYEMQKILEEFFRKKKLQEKYKNEYVGDWYEEKQVIKIPITIRNVMETFTPEQLIDAIGIEKVESILRAHKIKKLKKEIK